MEEQSEIDINTARILTPIAFLMETGKISIAKEKYLVILKKGFLHFSCKKHCKYLRTIY